ncbi:MAG: hypothetical protein P4M09_24470 [Devosia sp.]|nr:hypothetical protein [Devosia sp.]
MRLCLVIAATLLLAPGQAIADASLPSGQPQGNPPDPVPLAWGNTCGIPASGAPGYTASERDCTSIPSPPAPTGPCDCRGIPASGAHGYAEIPIHLGAAPAQLGKRIGLGRASRPWTFDAAAGRSTETLEDLRHEAAPR